MKQLVARLWNAGPIGKILVAVVALLLSCCALGIIGNLVNPQAARQRAEQLRQTSTAAAQLAEATARTVPTTLAIAPTLAEPTTAPTSVPSAPPPATAAPQSTIKQTTATVPTSSTTSAAGSALAPPPDLPAAPVVRVVDGDTVDVRLDGQVVRLRLIGIDTPEIVDPREPVQCFGREASAKAHELLDGQTVTLEADSTQDDVDRYGRRLRYIWLPDGRLFNQEMIGQGYAFEYTYRVPYKYQAEFKQTEREAREAQRGLWSPQTCAGEHRPADAAQSSPQPNPAAVPQPAPSPAPPRTEPSPAPAEQPATGINCDPAYPNVCIPPPPPDLDCGDIPYHNIRVLPPDPHRFDRDKDGIGCES